MTAKQCKINPQSDKVEIDNVDIDNEHNFPKFLKKIELSPFRHIDNVTIEFKHPISVITGTNRSGKSTVLMALACSHFNFRKRNPKNGNLDRQTWSSLMKFTNHDHQQKDWTYYITYKFGNKLFERKRGQRKHSTNKWNGIGKKESQFKDREAIFIDLERMLPPRNYNESLLRIAKTSSPTNISKKNVKEIESLISYVLEEEFNLSKIAQQYDKDIFKYNNNNEYSSYNAATGEEVISKIIIDIVDAEKNALILIDEIEMGLHPKVQRRLVDVLYYVARYHNKQFIITTHSPTILESLPEISRNFIERKTDGTFKCISSISINAALSKMDSQSFPLADIFVEDRIAKKIVEKAISKIQKNYRLQHFKDLINIIISNGAKEAYENFEVHKRTYEHKKIKAGYACILDGDQKKQMKERDKLQPHDDLLHFFYSDKAPEVFLIEAFLQKHPNPTMRYHVGQSNPHVLFRKMVETSLAMSEDDAFEKCWEIFSNSHEGDQYFESLMNYILYVAKYFSKDL